ncbi:MAG: glycosyltransferase family 4 protein [Bacteroidota bacterium]|jgi:glycosyltransferase involved in cell wall biosynthesis
MKILQITPRFPWPLKDGGALCYHNYAKGYSQAGVNLTIASLNTSKHYVEYDELPAHVKALGNIYLTYIDNKIKPIQAFLNLFSKESYHVKRFINEDFKNQLIQICKENTFDVIVFETIFVAPYLSVIRQNSKAKCILRQHNVEYQIWETLACNEKNPVKKWYLYLLANRLKKFEQEQLNNFDGIAAITKHDSNVFLKSGCTKPIHVSPFGINLDKLIIDDSNLEMPSIFHIGSMDWMPNQEAMLWFIDKVWYDMNFEFPELKFYLAGRNIPNSFFDYNNQNHIGVLGEIDNAIQFMNEKAIMVVPLFSGSGIRVKILEGMGLGKCIIATSLGAQGIEAINGEHILIAETADEFKNHIRNLINNPSEIIRIGKNALRLVKDKYDNKKIVADTLNFYESLNKI